MKLAGRLVNYGFKWNRLLFLTTPFIYQHFNQRRTECRILPKNDGKEEQYFRKLTHEEISRITHQYPNITVLESKIVDHIITHIRDKTTQMKEFRVYADRLIRVVVEYTLAISEKKSVRRLSPLGYYESEELVTKDDDICIVSILRSGNAFLPEMLKVLPGASIGQILIQRDEKTAEAHLLFSKLPSDIASKKIFLVDPMLGTGGSAASALNVLKKAGVLEKNILFLNLVSCEQGLTKVAKEFPEIKIITAACDLELLPDVKYIAPGIGDFGDRYFGTLH